MRRKARQFGQDFARSTIGALNLGMPLLYTMETWWLAWRLPIWVLGAFAFGGLAVIALATNFVGFEGSRPGRDKSWGRLAQDFVTLMLSTFVAAYAVLLLFGIVELGDPAQDVVRHGLIQVVPLGLGAAIANVVFQSVDKEKEQGETPSFGKEAATFGLGAAFFAFSVAPTEEMELMAAHAGWWRLVLVAAGTLVFTYLVLYVIEFRGRAGRLAGMQSRWLQWGETLVGYAIALAVSVFLLFGYGHLLDVTPPEMVQKTVVLSMIASFGGAAARVVV